METPRQSADAPPPTQGNPAKRPRVAVILRRVVRVRVHLSDRKAGGG